MWFIIPHKYALMADSFPSSDFSRLRYTVLDVKIGQGGREGDDYEKKGPSRL